MIESVNIVSSQTPQTLKDAPQGSGSVPVSEPVSSETNNFVSSNIRMDNLQNVAILEYRSSKTGEVIQQYPNQAHIQAFKQAEKLAAAIEPAPQPQQTADTHETAGTTASGSAPIIAQPAETPAPKAAPVHVAAPAPAEHSSPAPSANSTQSVVV
jgi:hypothetical protein